MAYSFPLSDQLSKQGWKAKIRDKERCETPHVSILLKTRAWRLSLRDGKFLDEGDKWSQIDNRVKNAITAAAAWQRLRQEWNAMYPENPVG